MIEWSYLSAKVQAAGEMDRKPRLYTLIPSTLEYTELGLGTIFSGELFPREEPFNPIRILFHILLQ